MFGKNRWTLKSLTAVVIIAITSACGEVKYDNFESLDNKILSSIDGANYIQAEHLINTHLRDFSSQEQQLKLNTYKMQINMAKGSFLLNEIVINFSSKQTLSSPQLEKLFNSCSLTKIKSAPETHCSIARLINILPKKSTHIEEALKIGKKLLTKHPNADKVRTLVALMNISNFIKEFGNVLTLYMSLPNNNMQDPKWSELKTRIYSLAKDYYKTISQLNESPEWLEKKLSGKTNLNILGTDKNILYFSESTGIPKLIETINPNKDSLDSKVIRSLAIQEIDVILRKYFFIRNP